MENQKAIFSDDFYARLSRENRLRDMTYALNAYGWVLPFHGEFTFIDFAEAITKSFDTSTECPLGNYLYHLLKRHDGRIVRRAGDFVSASAVYRP